MSKEDYLRAHYLAPSSSSSNKPGKATKSSSSQSRGNIRIISDDLDSFDYRAPDEEDSRPTKPTPVQSGTSWKPVTSKTDKNLSDSRLSTAADEDDDDEIVVPRRRPGQDSDEISRATLTNHRVSNKNTAESSKTTEEDEDDDDEIVVPRRRDQPKMASGAPVGLQSAESVRRETERAQQAEKERLAAIDPSLSGRYAQTVYRDAAGRLVDPRDTERRAEEERLRKLREKQDRLENNKGTAQKRQLEDRQRELNEMKSAPFARDINDEKLNDYYKSRTHWDDPMKQQVAASKSSEPKKPSYKGSAPPNRFGIVPGYRWDGVDRSNGFEAKWFRQKYNKAAQDYEAYKWATDDL